MYTVINLSGRVHILRLLMQLRPDEEVDDMLRRLLAHERQLTRLDVGGSWIPYRGGELKVKQLSSLTALRHLNTYGMPPLGRSDCRAVGGLTQLTMLEIPECTRVSDAACAQEVFCKLQH